MAKRPIINTISTDVSGLDTPLNENFTNIQNKFEEFLSLDGSTPNAMSADLDMNSNDILNVKDVFATRVYLNGSLLTVTDVSTISLEGRVSFDTKSLAEAATIDAAVNGFVVLGYTDPGDGGSAAYKRVSSEPSHGLKIQSNDGAWWEIDEKFIFPEMAGAVGDGTANDSAAFTKISDYVEDKGNGFVVLAAAKVYSLQSDFEIHGATVSIVGPGSQDASELRFVNNASLSLRNCNASSFENVRFNKTTGATNVVAFEQSTTHGAAGSSNVAFSGCQFLGGDESVYVTNVQNLRFEKCRFVNTVGTYCVHLDGSGWDPGDAVGVRAEDNVDAVEFANCVFGGTQDGTEILVYINGKADSTKFTDCSFQRGANGAYLTSTGAALAAGEVPGFTYFTSGGFENGAEEAVYVEYANRVLSFNGVYISTDPTGGTDNVYLASTATCNAQFNGGHIRAAGRDGIRADHAGTLQIANTYFDRNGVNTTGDHIRINSAVRLTTITGPILENSSGSVTRHGININTTNPVNISTVTSFGLSGNTIQNTAANVQSKVAATYEYDRPDINYELVVSGTVSTGYNRVARIPGGYYRLVVYGGVTSADSCSTRLYFTPAGGIRTAIGTANITVSNTESYTYLITDPEIDAADGGLLEVRVVSLTGTPTDLEVAFGLQRLIES